MEQEEELDSLAYLYSEEELIILNKSPVHIQVRVQSSPASTTSPIKALLDLEWGENYPNEKPIIHIISMDIPAEDKEMLCNSLYSTCDDCMGMAMTYVLSSTLQTLLTDWHENLLTKVKSESTAEVIEESKQVSAETTVKLQKRKETNEKMEEKPRGWNWVTVLSHLRKTADT